MTTASFRVHVTAVGFALFVSACCAKPPALPSSSEPVTVEPLAPPPAPGPGSAAPSEDLLTPPTDDAALSKLFEGANCLYVSAKGQVACISSLNDMGYGTITLEVFGAGLPNFITTLYGYGPMVFERKHLHLEAYAGANAFLDAGKFGGQAKKLDARAATMSGTELVVKDGGMQGSVYVPPMSDTDAPTPGLQPHVGTCCAWKPTAVWVFEEETVAAVHIAQGCDWTRTAGPGRAQRVRRRRLQPRKRRSAGTLRRRQAQALAAAGYTAARYTTAVCTRACRCRFPRWSGSGLATRM